MYIHKNHTQNTDIFSKEYMELTYLSQKATLCNMNLLFSFSPSLFPSLSHSFFLSPFLYFFNVFAPLSPPLDLFITYLIKQKTEKIIN